MMVRGLVPFSPRGAVISPFLILNAEVLAMGRSVLVVLSGALGLALLGVIIFMLQGGEAGRTEVTIAVCVLAGVSLVVLILSLLGHRTTVGEGTTLSLIVLGGMAAVCALLYVRQPGLLPWAYQPVSFPAKGGGPPPGDVNLGPFVPTPQEVVDKMLEVAKVTKDDVVYDLGCGDGRIVVTAAKKYGARGVGVDIDPQRIKESNENAKKAGVESLVEFREGDAFKVEDIGKASVVTLYVLPDAAQKLRPTLQRELKPGSRVVAHDFDMGELWVPDHTQVHFSKENRRHLVFLWNIDEKTREQAKKSEEQKKGEEEKK
jgi:SAM-dependent methyltransferase